MIVELKQGSVWNVTGAGYLTALTVEAGSVLRGKLVVDGKETDPKPGTYRGIIRVFPGDQGCA